MNSELKQILISCYKEEMISFLTKRSDLFDEAIELALSDEQPFAWRAAWLLWSCMENNDKRIKKHLARIVNAVKSKNDGHQRDLIIILSKMELSSKHEGVLFDICMNVWEQISKSPSVRITAFKFIIKIAQKHRELKREIPFLVQDHLLDSLSPGVKRSISKMMKEFDLEFG
jgi:hypothetical protein